MIFCYTSMLYMKDGQAPFKMLQGIYRLIGLAKCLHYTYQTVYMPGLYNEFQDLVNNCQICLKYGNTNDNKPVSQWLCQEIPLIPWRKSMSSLSEPRYRRQWNIYMENKLGQVYQCLVLWGWRKDQYQWAAHKLRLYVNLTLKLLGILLSLYFKYAVINEYLSTKLINCYIKNKVWVLYWQKGWKLRVLLRVHVLYMVLVHATWAQKPNYGYST